MSSGATLGEWHEYNRLLDGREPVWSKKEYVFRDDSGREIGFGRNNTT